MWLRGCGAVSVLGAASGQERTPQNCGPIVLLFKGREKQETAKATESCGDGLSGKDILCSAFRDDRFAAKDASGSLLKGINWLFAEQLEGDKEQHLGWLSVSDAWGCWISRSSR